MTNHRALRMDRPAPYWPLVGMLEREGVGAKIPLDVARNNLRAGLSYGFYDADDQCVICAGLGKNVLYGVPVDEVWFCCSQDAAPYILSFIRLSQLTLEMLCNDRPIIARVAETRQSGKKLAKMLGFKLATKRGGFEIWTRG